MAKTSEAAFREDGNKSVADASRRRRGPAPLAIAVGIVIILGAVVFLTAGSLDYPQGWVVWAVYAVFMLGATVYLKGNPQLLARRMQAGQDHIARRPPAVLNLFFLCYLIPGLDWRFGWSSVPLWLVIVSDVLVASGCVIVLLVFRANRFASASVQVEEGQQVVTTGPYRIVRHPMYLGIVLMVVFTPLALGSFWGLIPALLVIPLNVIRLKGEEDLLADGLPGYREYRARTRFRLFPGIW